MIWRLIITSSFYWASVAADFWATRRAIARGFVESNPRFVGQDGQGVRYGKNLAYSLAVWGLGVAVAVILPEPCSIVGTAWIAFRGGMRATDAARNWRKLRAT